MFSTTRLERNILTILSSFTYLYISALTTLTSLNTTLLNRRQYESCTAPQSTSITKILTRYISRSILTSTTITCDRSGSSYPLLPPLPSRQPSNLSLNQLPPFDPQTALATHIHTLATIHHPSTLYLGHTTFSHPSTPALYGRCRHNHHIPSHSHTTTTTTYTYLGRICHLSPLTNRLSVTVHPNDIDTIIKAGWGQRANVLDEALLHAPKNEHDLTILKMILQAAIGYVCSTGEIENGNDEIPWEESERWERPKWLLPRYAL